MQIYRAPCRNCKPKGLGQYEALLGAAASLIGGGGSGSSSGSGGGGGGSTSVSPQISTQISPQISPVFQQQFQPTNSAATAGTASSPSFGTPGFAPDGSYTPGAYPALPGGGALPASIPMPATASTGSGLPAWAPWAILGLGAVGFIMLSKKKGQH